MYKYKEGNEYLSAANLLKLREHCKQLDVVYRAFPDRVSSMIDSDINEHSFRGMIRKMYRKLQTQGL